VFNVHRLKIGLGILNCVAGIKCFILDVMQLLAIVMSNVACTVTHNVDILHVTNVAVRTLCEAKCKNNYIGNVQYCYIGLITAVFTRTV